MSRRLIGALLTLVMVLGMFQGIVSAEEGTVTAAKSDYFFRILELSPNQKDFVLKQSDFDKNSVKLYQFTIREYNAIREDMIGRYDIVYIGNGKSDSEEYYTLGDPVKKIPASKSIKNGSLIPAVHSSMPVYEYYPGNDATELVLSYIEDLNDAGQLVVADSALAGFSSSSARIHKFVKDSSFIQKVNRSDVKSVLGSYTDYDSYAAVATPRPYLNIASSPKEFDGSDASYIDTSLNSGVSSLDFEFAAMGYDDDTTYDINFYFDINGDNKYKASDNELIKSKTGVASSERLTFTMALPDNFKGLQPYKFEIIDRATGAVNYKTGYLGFRGDDPIVVNVLQIACNGNTFNLATDLIGKKKENLLTAFSDDYIINVDVITFSEYVKLYNDPDFTLTEYTGPDNDKTYNMIIYGFADMYGNSDLKNETMANDLKKFINTGQSVMFTHDVLSFFVDRNSGWGHNFNKYFRDFVGQNIYSDGDYPKPEYITLGFSDMAYERAEGKGFKESNNVYAFNDGIMTNYPFPLIKKSDQEFYDATYGNRLLNVAKTHYQYYELDLNNEDVVVWYTLADANSRIDHLDPASFYYTYSIGNVTYSGTGHTDLDKANAFPERELFVNTIIKAIRGANFAPEVTIQGVNSGDEVSRLTETLTFSIIASDPDINDQYMDGVVYLDMDGDGSYESDEVVAVYDKDDQSDGSGSGLKNGVAREVTLDLTKLDPDLTEFSFKVIATDSSGAAGFKTSVHPLVDMPVITLEISSADGMLLGDKKTVTTRALLTNPDDSKETRIHDIELASGIYDKDSHNTAYDVTDTTDYVISGYSSDYSVSGKVLKDAVSDIVDPAKGIVDQSIMSWSYDIEAKREGIYYLGSELDYELEYYKRNENKQTGKLFEARRGILTYSLTDDLGAPVDSDISAKLYHFDTLAEVVDLDDPELSNGQIVDNVTVVDGNVTVGDDTDELLETGYYVLVTESKDQYGSGKSVAVYLDYTDPNKVIEMEVQSTQIYGYRWVHKGASNTAGGLNVLDGTEIGNTEIRFTTLSDFNELTFGYDGSAANSLMSMTLVKITHVASDSTETEVTGKFTHDTVNETFSWNDSGKMPEGEYIFELNHQFYNGTGQGSYVEYKLEPEIDVKIDNISGESVKRSYSFPEVVDEILGFLKAVDLL